MGKKLIFVEANLTGTTYEAMRLAKSNKLTVIFLTRNSRFYSTCSHSPFDIADQFLSCNTLDFFSIYEVVSNNFGRMEVAGIICFDDYHLLACAEAAKKLGLPGPDVNSLSAALSKSRVREILQWNYSYMTHYIGHELPEICIDESNKWVVKPDSESGGNFVRLCHNEGHLKNWLNSYIATHHNPRNIPLPNTILIEEFVDGPEYSCEAIYDCKEKEWKIIGYTEKLTSGQPHFIELSHRYPAMLKKNYDDKILSWLRRLELVCGAAHIEFKLVNDNPVLIEINPRLPGGNITQIVELASGVNMVAEYLSFHIEGGGVKWNDKKQHEVGYVKFITPNQLSSSHVAEISDFLEKLGCVDYSINTNPKCSTDPSFQSNFDRAGYFILAGPADIVESKIAWFESAFGECYK